jgi:uncharacterized damage-inducible protein DinB
MNSTIFTQLKDQTKLRIGEESIPRIIKCLDMITEEQVWHKPNASTNSIGNLTLHLIGNATQWIVVTFSGIPDHRNRDAEFSESDVCNKDELKSRLTKLKKDLFTTLESVTEDDVERIHQVQCFAESGTSILVHVTEHFSYHTGQIALLTKLLTNEETHFYTDLDLNKTK